MLFGNDCLIWVICFLVVWVIFSVLVLDCLIIFRLIIFMLLLWNLVLLFIVVSLILVIFFNCIRYLLLLMVIVNVVKLFGVKKFLVICILKFWLNDFICLVGSFMFLEWIIDLMFVIVILWVVMDVLFNYIFMV